MRDNLDIIFIGLFFAFTALILISIYQQGTIEGEWDIVTVYFIKCIAFLIIIALGFWALFGRN